MADSRLRIPATIVTGFLGAGKTTLINDLLHRNDLGRVAALVNDFGTLDIDAALIAEVADEVIQLSNGCVCCSINGDLYKAIENVISIRPSVDRIVIETTGLADPLPVGLTLLQTDLAARVSLEAMVTVVDCANFALDLFQSDAAMSQLAHADIVVLNKCDLVERDKIDGFEQRISVIRPQARFIEAIQGRVAASAILSTSAEPSVQGEHRSYPQHHHNHLFDDGFSAHAFEIEAPMSASRFQSWLNAGFPRSVFRAKGLVRFDRRDDIFEFQYCGGRANFFPFNGSVERCRMVFIGQGIDGLELERLTRMCLIEPATRNAQPQIGLS